MEYKCVKIPENMAVDGDLDKPEWKAAESVRLVDVATGGDVRLNTTVKLLWSDDFIYAGFHCEDDYVFATMTGYNDRLYEEDVVEIFLDDDRDLKTYVELEVNPLNAVLHYEIHNHFDRRFIQFARVARVVRSAVRRREDGKAYDVELAIPFSEFISTGGRSPKKGDRWLFNLFRIDRARDGSAEYSAWSPTGEIDFHIPQSFGELIFC